MGLGDRASFIYVDALIHSRTILILPILLPYCIMSVMFGSTLQI